MVLFVIEMYDSIRVIFNLKDWDFSKKRKNWRLRENQLCVIYIIFEIYFKFKGNDINCNFI